MQIVGRAGGCFVAALLVMAGCGTGVAPQGETGFTDAEAQGHRSAPRGVVLSVQREDAGACGQDREFRFGVENHSRSRLTGGLLRFDLDDALRPDRQLLDRSDDVLGHAGSRTVLIGRDYSTGV